MELVSSGLPPFITPPMRYYISSQCRDCPIRDILTNQKTILGTLRSGWRVHDIPMLLALGSIHSIEGVYPR